MAAERAAKVKDGDDALKQAADAERLADVEELSDRKIYRDGNSAIRLVIWADNGQRDVYEGTVDFGKERPVKAK
jgi:hypothetical protein